MEYPNVAQATRGNGNVDKTMTAIRRMEQAMENEASTFTTHWRELSDYIKPRRSRFYPNDTNKGDKRNTNILDATGTMAVNTLASGIMGGVTNPARPWRKLKASNPLLDKNKNVAKWLEEVDERMDAVFSKSNTYNVLPDLYADVATFATGCVFVEEDFDSVLRLYSFPIGEYFLGTDDTGRVDKFYRKFQMTVHQIVEKFVKLPNGKMDWSKCSAHVKNLYETGATESWIEVRHVIFPNKDWDARKPESRYKQWKSVHHETSVSDATEMENMLSEKGYDYFPIIAPRWRRAGTDIYGTDSPGMIALGDIKQLQKVQSRILLATEKSVNPSMKAPTSLKGKKITQLPGDVTFVDQTDTQKYEPTHEPTLNLQHAILLQQETRDRINEAFFVPLFLMLSMSDRRNITAREVEEKQEEKLLMIGPVLFTIEEEILNPLVNITYTLMLRQGLIPPPPEEFQDQELRAEYISILFQAQKMTGLAQHERFQMYAGQWAALDPTALDGVNKDAVMRSYADMVGMPADTMLDQEEVDGIRAERQQAMQAQQQAEMQAKQAKAAKDLGTTPLGQGSALDGLLDQAEAGDMVGMVGE